MIHCDTTSLAYLLTNINWYWTRLVIDILIIKTKLEPVSLSCKSHRSKTANITILFANSKHKS